MQFSNGSVAGVGAEPFSTPQPPARRGGIVGVSLFEGGGGQVMGGNGETRSGKEKALPELGAGIADGAQLGAGLDSFGHDGGSQLFAQLDHDRDQLLLAALSVKILHERSVQLDDLGFEIRDELQVRVARAEIIDDQVRPCPGTDFAQHAHAKVEVGERHRFGDLKVDVVVVRKDGVIGTHEPAVRQLVGWRLKKTGVPPHKGTAISRIIRPSLPVDRSAAARCKSVTGAKPGNPHRTSVSYRSRKE